MFYAYCPGCSSLGFVVVYSRVGEGIEPDPELCSVKQARFAPPITSNDVIDMHIFLNGFRGDISTLLSEK